MTEMPNSAAAGETNLATDLLSLPQDRRRHIPIAVTGGCMLALFGAVATAFALSLVPPTSYMEVTEGGQYVLVMLVPPDQRPNRDPNAPWDAISIELEAKYKQSGLYRNGAWPCGSVLFPPPAKTEQDTYRRMTN